MNKFWALVTAFIELIIGTLGAVGVDYIIKLSDIFWFLKFLLITSLVIVIFILYMINALIFSKLYDCLFFIRKWFMPQTYIEGIWVQIINDNALSYVPPTKYTLLNIQMVEGRIVIEGYSYNQNNGGQMTSFKIPFTIFINDTLEYYYGFNTKEFRDIPHCIGKGILCFEKKVGGKYFCKYNGKIISNLPRERNEILVQGFKSFRKIRLKNGKKIKINEVTIKQKEVREYIDNYIQNVF